jgi:hypothetical protein
MPPITKKPCINSSEWTYTGKEVSPTGLGYAPDGETEGTKMKGRDDTMWIVGRKNGVKVWNRVPTVLVKEEPAMKHDDKETENDSENESDEDETKTPVKETKPLPKTPPAPKKVKKDIVSKIDPKDVTINKNLIDRLNEVADEPVEEIVPEPKKEEPKVEVPAPVPEKKKRAPAKKKEKETVVPPVQPAKEEVVEAKPEPAAPTPEPVVEKKKRAPAKKKEAAEGEAKKTDYQLFLTERLKTIEGATHKERFGAAAKEWGAMTPEQKVAAVANLK